MARYTRIAREKLQVQPSWKTKAVRAAQLALEELGEAPGGFLEIQCSLAIGIGLGSSTCDVVATVRAVCAAFDVQPDPQWIARIAVDAECAADPIMFDNQAMLFAQRCGEVLESFDAWTPPFTVLSADIDASRGGIDTLSLQLPNYTERQIAELEGLIDLARAAFRQRDVAAIARVATASARLNQCFAPLRRFAEVCALAERHHALGVQISHSGTLVGILFDSSQVSPDSEVIARVRAELQALDVRALGQFMIRAEAAP